MKIKEIRNLSAEDLKTRLKELQQEQLKLNVQLATGTTPKSPGQVRQVRKTIARIHTIMKTKQSQNTKQVTKKEENKQ
jgi:large subunit ribosomal protein L29